VTGEADFHERFTADRIRILGSLRCVGAEVRADLTLPDMALAFLFLDHRECVFIDIRLVGAHHRTEQRAQVAIELAAVFVLQAGDQQRRVQP